MKNTKATAKVHAAPKVSLAEQLKMKAETANSLRVTIPVNNLLGFDPQNPETEDGLIFGRPRKVLRWNVSIDGKNAVAVLMVGQIARLYQAILEENLPEGISLDDYSQSIVVMTDKFTTDYRGQKQANGNGGFLNLSPLTRSASESAVAISGFQFSE